MRYTEMKKCILNVLFICLVLYSSFSNVKAEERGTSASTATINSPEEYEPGEPFQAEGSYFLGYRFLSRRIL